MILTHKLLFEPMYESEYVCFAYGSPPFMNPLACFIEGILAFLSSIFLFTITSCLSLYSDLSWRMLFNFNKGILGFNQIFYRF